MTFRTLIVSAFLAATFALGAAGCAKSPEDVCGHMEKLMTKEAGAELAKKFTKGCVKDVSRRKEMKGYMKYRKESRCIVAAGKLADLEKCK